MQREISVFSVVLFLFNISLLAGGKNSVNGKDIIYQRPVPNITVKDQDTGKEVIKFNINECKNLLSYQFSLSVNDITGSFSITLFPDWNTTTGYKSLCDILQKLQIVEIYEGDKKPAFTGIIRRKKYVGQTSDDGGVRRLVISGTGVTGLVSQFYINCDVKAQALTGQYIANEAVRKALTLNLADKKKIKDVIKAIWDQFLEISKQNGTPKIAEYINKFMGGDFFDVEELDLKYPLGCVFMGEQTQDFYSLIDGIIPAPYYEKFAYVDTDGKMKIKIRKCQFSDKWTSLPITELQANEVKNFDLCESDDEVYTAFYAYLNGYPIDEQKTLILSTMNNKIDPTLIISSKKYQVYGYRPLIVHFLGYSPKDGEQDSDTSLQDVTEEIKEWFENLPDMYSGNINLAMTYEKSSIQPGERVAYLGGEFYVEGVSHSWNYIGGGEINLSVSRGGVYSSGKFSKFKELTKLINLLQRGIS